MRDYQTKANQGGLPDSITATRFGAGEFNSIALELEHAVTTSGQTLAPADGTGEATDQLGKALAAYASAGDFYEDTGVADAYVLSRPGGLEDIEDYFDGMKAVFKVGNASTGPSTVNISSLGVKDIRKIGGGALVASDLRADEYTIIRYNDSAGYFEIQLYFGTRALSLLDGITVGGNSSADIVTIGATQTITGDKTFSGNIGYPVFASKPLFQSTSDRFYDLYFTAASANQKRWRWYPGDGFLNFENVDDAYTTPVTAFTIGRSGSTPAYFYLNSLLKVTDPTSSASFTPIRSFGPNLSAGGGELYLFHGVAESNYNCGQLTFFYFASGSQDNEFRIGHYGNGAMIRINGYGNVGIGDAPALSGGARLTVAGDTFLTGPYHVSFDSGGSGIRATSASIYTVHYGGTLLTDGAAVLCYGNSHATEPGKIRLFTNNTERMEIDNAGNIALTGTLTVNGGAITSAGQMCTNASGYPYIDITDFDVDSNLTISTWESIGPTASGATNIWTALDVIPAGADWVKVRIEVNCYSSGDTANTSREVIVYTRKNGTAASAGSNSQVVWSSSYTSAAGNAKAVCIPEVVIPLTASNIFDMQWYSTFASGNSIILRGVVGYGYNE